MFQRWIAYLRSWLDRTPEEVIDPEIDIQAAIDEARRRDQDLRNQAAKAIADKIRLASEIRKAATLVGQAEEMAKQAVLMAEEAKEAGDEAGVAAWVGAAEGLSVKMRAADGELTWLKSHYERSVNRAEQAKEAVHANARAVQQWSAQHLEGFRSDDRAELWGAVDNAVEAMFTSIADEGPDLETLEREIEQHRATAMTEAALRYFSPEPGEPGLNRTVDMAEEAEAKLDAIRRDLGM